MFFRSLAKDDFVSGRHVMYSFLVFSNKEMKRIEKRVADFQYSSLVRIFWFAQIKFQPIGGVAEAKTWNSFMKQSP